MKSKKVFVLVVLAIAVFTIITIIQLWGHKAAADTTDESSGTHTLIGPVYNLWEHRVQDVWFGDNTVSPDESRVFTTGATSDWNTADIVTVANDAETGIQLWMNFYSGAAGHRNESRALAVSPDGTHIYVAGGGWVLTEYGYYWDCITIAYNSLTGEELWVSQYNGTINGSDLAVDIVVSPDGNWVYVFGYSNGWGLSNEYMTIAHNSQTGEKVWVSIHENTGQDIPTAMTIHPEGTKLFVTGYNASQGTSRTVAYNALTGEELWVKERLGNWRVSIVVDPDGSSIYIAGRWVVARYTSTGNAQWETYIGAVNPKIEIDTTHNKLLTAGTNIVPAIDYSGDIVIRALDKQDGAQLWENAYYGSTDDSHEYMLDLSISPDNQLVYMTGFTAPVEVIQEPWGEPYRQITPTDLVTIAYTTSNGQQVLKALYDGPANGNEGWGAGASSAIDSEGALYVSCLSQSLTGHDWVTIAYTDEIDTDGDGIPDDQDACPNEDSTGLDADEDGCIDSFSGLIDVLDTLVSEGVIDYQMRNSLIRKIQNAWASSDRENICVAVNQLEAFKNQIEAQRGHKISDEAADLLIAYADNLVAQLLSELAPGESC